MVMYGVRYAVCFAIWVSLLSFYVLRTNMSVAILAMTTDIYASSGNSTSKIVNNTSVQFTWDDSLKGKILGGFFCGYASTHFLGALASAKFGPRILLSVCLIGSSIATFITPYLTHKSPYALIVARVVVGVFSGSLYPIIQEILGVWTPQSERTVLAALTHSGNIFGIVITYFVGAYFCSPRFHQKGWEYFFYFSGGLSSVALLLWLLFGFDSPSKHPCISKKELNYIKGTSDEEPVADSHGGPLPSLDSIPFYEIFTSIPVWSATAAHTGYLFIFYAMITGQSKFLSDVFHLSVPNASQLSAIPFVANFIVQILIPPVVDYLRTKRNINTTTIRKVVSAIGFTFGCFTFMGVGYFKSDQLLYMICVMVFALGIIGLNNSGYLTASIDIAPAYAGIVMGIMNTFGSLAGFLNATMAGILVQKYKDNKILGWRYTFIITGVVSLIFSLFFVIFGSSELQYWSKGKVYVPLKQADEAKLLLETAPGKDADEVTVKVSRV